MNNGRGSPAGVIDSARHAGVEIEIIPRARVRKGLRTDGLEVRIEEDALDAAVSASERTATR